MRPAAGPPPQAPPAARPGPPPRADREAEAVRAAGRIDATAFPAAAAAALGLDPADRYGLRLFLAEAWARGADPADPVERMLHEQLVVVHHRAAAVHARATEAGSDAAEAVLSAAAARLTAEAARVVDALTRYRAGEAARGRYAKAGRAHRTGK